MTKKQWREILEKLKEYRSARKFRSGIFYIHSTGVAKSEYLHIESINTNKEGFIKFQFGERLSFEDINKIPKERLQRRFQLMMSPFDILKTKFSKGEIK